MLLQPVDWAIIALFFLVSLVVGVAVTRKAGTSAAEFFAAGRRMPWWLLGISMVATTFSTDTPNLVTNLVRDHIRLREIPRCSEALAQGGEEAGIEVNFLVERTIKWTGCSLREATG